MKKKVGIITGARSEFGIMELVMDLINSSSTLELFLYVTGMHLIKKFGYY